MRLGNRVRDFIDGLGWRLSRRPVQWARDLWTWPRRRRWHREAAALLAEAPAAHWIPQATSYCYQGWTTTAEGRPTSYGHCPFMRHVDEFDLMESGYCALMRDADWRYGVGHLWDDLKVCGINVEPREDDEPTEGTDGQESA